MSPALEVDSLPAEPLGKSLYGENNGQEETCFSFPSDPVVGVELLFIVSRLKSTELDLG